MMAIHFLSSMGANTGREVSFPSVLSWAFHSRPTSGIHARCSR